MIEILMGHHISPSCPHGAGPFNYWHITPSRLERKFEECSDYRRVTRVNLLKAAACSEQKHILLTVDDGFRGFKEDVLPLLDHYQIGCIIFLTTGFIDAKLHPYELELARIVNTSDAIAWHRRNTANAPDVHSKQGMYEHLRLAIKSKSNRERQDFIKSLIQSIPVLDREPAPNLFLDWNEIQELDRHPLITIGAHTETHLLLPAIGWREAYHEIHQSKKRIESKLGHRLECFSYPYGGYSLPVQILVRLAGFKYAFTTESQVLTADRFNPLALPRIDLQRSPKLSMSDE